MQTGPRILLAFGWYDYHSHAGIVRYAREHNWCLRAEFASGLYELPERWDGDGLLICNAGSTDSKHFQQLVESSAVPALLVDTDFSVPSAANMKVDDRAISLMAARHFIERSFSHYIFIGDDPKAHGNRRRFHYYRETLQEAGHYCTPLWWKSTGRPTQKERNRIILALKEAPKPLAIFAVSDMVAARIIQACIEADIRIPEEIAILGVDNDELYGESTPIGLSSIDSQQKEKGYMAATLLDSILQGGAVPVTPVMVTPAGVISRASTDIMATDDPKVRKALDYIRAHYADDIRVEDIARHVGLSREGLRRAFKNSIGSPPGPILRKHRLDAAKKLLTTTDLKIESVALQAGMRDATRLCCTFRRELGLSPAAYRRKNAES